MGNMLAFSIGSRDLGTINMHKVTTPITLRCAVQPRPKTSTINSEVLLEGSRNIFTPPFLSRKKYWPKVTKSVKSLDKSAKMQHFKVRDGGYS